VKATSRGYHESTKIGKHEKGTELEEEKTEEDLISHRVTEKTERTIFLFQNPKKPSSFSVTLATRRGAGVRLPFLPLTESQRRQSEEQNKIVKFFLNPLGTLWL
jgi:hypothetical protein